MLARNLLYTGVTRGKRLVVLVGQKKAVGIAVQGRADEEALDQAAGVALSSICIPLGFFFSITSIERSIERRTDTLEFSRASACYLSELRSCEPESQWVVLPRRVASEAA